MAEECCENCRFWKDYKHRQDRVVDRGTDVGMIESFAGALSITEESAAKRLQDAFETLPEGLCRRYPHLAVMFPAGRDGELDFRQPHTLAQDWCGEWKAKE